VRSAINNYPMEQMLVFVHMSVRIALIALVKCSTFVQTAQESLSNDREDSKQFRAKVQNYIQTIKGSKLSLLPLVIQMPA